MEVQRKLTEVSLNELGFYTHQIFGFRSCPVKGLRDEISFADLESRFFKDEIFKRLAKRDLTDDFLSFCHNDDQIIRVKLKDMKARIQAVFAQFALLRKKGVSSIEELVVYSVDKDGFYKFPFSDDGPNRKLWGMLVAQKKLTKRTEINTFLKLLLMILTFL